MTAPLHGLRVLDFGRYIAGPFCAAMLGDLGADVIRVERLEGGEDRALFPVSNDDGAYVLQMNRNKRGFTLDSASERGREVLARLVETSDVVVANLPREVRGKLGLDYESLHAVHPGIIVASISAFGEAGPYADRIGFDGIGQAMSGASWLSGVPGRPAKSFTTWVDYLTALFAAVGILAALHERQTSGKGQEIQTSLFASALASMSIFIGEQSATGVNRQATGNRMQSSGPGDFFQTSDGWIVLQCVGDAQFRRWAKLMGADHLCDDPQLATDALRASSGEQLSRITSEWCAARTTSAVLTEFERARLPAGPILSPQQVLEDPHVLSTGMLSNIPVGADKPFALILSALRLGGAVPPVRRLPPKVGEHTDEILAELGYSPARVEALRRAGVV